MEKVAFNLTDTFNAFADRAVADFPQLEGRFSIYSAPTRTVHGSFPAEEEARLVGLQKEQVEKFLREHGDRPHGYATHDGDYSLINYLEEGTTRHNYITRNDPYEFEVRAAMEHELAHLIAPGANPQKGRSELFTECVAEAFAFIRMAQQTGSIKSLVEEACYMQANIAILKGNTTHFCIPVIREVGRLAETQDLKNLTPQQTANMAYRLAVLYAPSTQDLRAIEAAFRPTLNAFRDKSIGWEPPMFDAAIATTLAAYEAAEPYIFMAGISFLQPFADTRSDIIPATLFSAEELSTLFKGEAWEAFRTSLRQHATTTPTAAERYVQEARDMMALGTFDKNPDAEMRPALYESAANMAYLQRAQDAYAALRARQDAGAADMQGLDRDAMAARAREQADAAAAAASPSRPKI